MPSRAVVVALCASLIAVGTADIGAQPTPEDDRAAVYLSTAEAYLDTGAYGRAEEYVLLALETAPRAPDVQTRAATLLNRVLKEKKAAEGRAGAAAESTMAFRQLLLLAEAHRLAADGRFEAAAETITGMLDKIEDPELLEKAEDALAAAHPGWLRRKWLEYKLGWPGDAALTIVGLLLLAALIQGLRRLNASRYARRWLVTDFDDKTGLGIGELTLEALRGWTEKGSPVSAGLLKLERLHVESIPRLEQKPPGIEFASALEGLPKLGGVSPGVVARLLQAVPAWLQGSRPSISGSAALAGGQLVLRLTSRDHNARVRTVSAVSTQGMEAYLATVDQVSFKMYYVIANDSTIPRAGTADRLRAGLDLLQSFIADGNLPVLERAFATFRELRSEDPPFPEAYLYEGIALDLLERHKDAEDCFQYLVDHAQGELQEKARYNQAISQFRKYRPDELERAIRNLDELIGEQALTDLRAEEPRLDRFTDSPIKALATAAKANAIAHRPIFWEVLLYNSRTEDADELTKRRADARAEVDGWVHEVRTLTERLHRLHEQLSASDLDDHPTTRWDAPAKRQLEWAIHNARGNAYLNYANRFLDGVEFYIMDEAAVKAHCLKEALAAFKKCEVLLPPSVETLSNLATVLLALGRLGDDRKHLLEDAREYAQAAIDLNRNYEYAYYRLVQAWEEDGRPDMAQKVIWNLPQPPKIPSFQKLIERYSSKA